MKMKEKRRNNNGITLIALVITIIVLLILAGISIATLTGQNGVLNKATTAKDESKKAEYKEILQLIGNGIRPEKVLENLSTEQFMDIYEKAIEEEINKGETFKEATRRRKDTESIVVVTKEKYVYLVTENKVEYLGKQTGENPPDLQEKDVEFTVLPEGEWTNSDVSVGMKSKIEGYILEYSTNDVTWKTYTEPVIMKENGTIHVRLSNGLEQAGVSCSKEITKIDKKGPTGSIEATSVKPSSITVSVTAQDVAEDEKNGCSGIKGYYYSSDGGTTYSEMKTEASYKFEGLTPVTDYNIVVKVVDNAENPTELTLHEKTTEPIYIVKDGKQMKGAPTFYSCNPAVGSESWSSNGGDFTSCHLKWYSVCTACYYWAVDVPSSDSEIYFSVDSPSDNCGRCNPGGFLFAIKSLPGNWDDYNGNTKRIKGSGGHFTGARPFSVKAPQSGRIYIGVAGDAAGSSTLKDHVIFRIYNAWIE